jgi:hypothetical protein
MTTEALSAAEALALIVQLRQENGDLRGVVGALERRIAELEQRIADLMTENKALRDQLDEAQRQAARQAAPFRRRETKKVGEGRRKRPGRPKGHPGAHRAVPAYVDDQIEVPLPCCPHCGGSVCGVEPIEQFIEAGSSRSSSSLRRSRRCARGSLTWSPTVATALSAARSRALTR